MSKSISDDLNRLIRHALDPSRTKNEQDDAIRRMREAVVAAGIHSSEIKLQVGGGGGETTQLRKTMYAALDLADQHFHENAYLRGVLADKAPECLKHAIEARQVSWRWDEALIIIQERLGFDPGWRKLVRKALGGITELRLERLERGTMALRDEDLERLRAMTVDVSRMK